jgi:signal transduction histidine kinase/ActR/RegA family two-component response regulator
MSPSPLFTLITAVPVFWALLLLGSGIAIGAVVAVYFSRRSNGNASTSTLLPTGKAPDDQELLRQLLEQADCLIWQACVRQESDGSFSWYDTFFTRSALDRRLYGHRDPNRPGIWDRERVPDLPEMDARSSAALRTGAPSYEQEFRFCRDDQVYWLHEYVTITPAGEGRWSLVGVVTDVTERHRLKTELQRGSKLESVGILAGGIAHDFNNVLTAIMGNLALAALDAEGNAGARRSLEEAERACLRARELTQELLTFARGGDPIRTTMRLPEVVRNSAQVSLHDARGVTCEFDFAADLWSVHADKAQITQVVRSLATNAAQAMPNGGTIKISARNETVNGTSSEPLRPGNYVRLTVSDSGSGIPPENLGKIFDPYFTTKSQGSGLGLAMVYSIAKRHQGHVSAESEFGRGATFHVWLPVARQPAMERETKRAPEAPRLAGRALVMDDEGPVRVLVAKFAQHLGLEVEMAPDGETAVSRCREAWERGTPFDLVVFDLTVPNGMGGRDALTEIRRFQPDIKAIVSSGYSNDPVMGNAHVHGFQGVVAKPYSLQEFEQTVRAVLGCTGGARGHAGA